MKKIIKNKINKVLRWFNDDEYMLTQICELFTLVTVINSYMIVYINDEPKIGKFAYIHLLMRLLILSVIIMIWEEKLIFSEIKSIILSTKNISALSQKEIRTMAYKKIVNYKITTISVLFTSITISICVGRIVGANEPRGGTIFYFNLLLIFGIITTIVFGTYLYEKLKILCYGK